MTSLRFTPLAALLFAAAATAACNNRPAAGDTCKPTDILCVDPKTELACQKGVFIVSPCKGPMGCREDGKHLVCDATGNLDGDPCSTDEEASAQCIGDGARMTCRGGKYAKDFCRGPAGCEAKTGTVRCDQSKSQEGDPCSGETSACSPDGKSVLSCHGGKFTMVASCPGENGCSTLERKINCDLGKKDDDKKKAVKP